MNSTISHGILNNVVVFEAFDSSKGDSFKKYIKTLEKLSKNELIISNISMEKEVNFREFFSNAIVDRKQYKDRNIDSLTSDLKGDFFDIPNEEFFMGYFEKPHEEEGATRIDLLEESQTLHLLRFIANNQREETHSNQPLLDTKNTFMLYPLKVIINEISIFVDIRITVYKHGYAILNFSTNLIDLDLEKFNVNQWDIDIDSAFLPRFMLNLENKNQYKSETTKEKVKYNKLGRCKDLASAIKRYVDIIQLVIGNEQLERETFHTLMISHERDLGKRDTPAYKENIYKLLHTPVLTMPPQLHIDKFFDGNLFEKKGFSNTYGNQHRLIYVVSEERFSNFQKEFPLYTDNVVIEHFYEGFHGDYFFAIEKLMLKKITDWKYMYNFFGETISSRKLYKINLNRISESRFENNQVFYQYSSMLELVDALFKSCIDKNVTNILEENKSKVLEISELRRNIIISEVSVLSSILVILLTSILSIPALTQTMEFFNIKNEYFISFSYVIVQTLVIVTVIAAFRDRLMEFFRNMINFPKNKFRHYKAIQNTKKYFRDKNNKTK